MKYIYPLEPNADITEGLDDRVVDMLLNHRDKINEVVEVIDSYFNIEEPESRLTSKEVQQIEMADDLREILRPYHKEGESYITTLKELLSSPEKKEEDRGMIWSIGKENEKKLKNKVLQTATREELIGYIEDLEQEPTQEFTKEELEEIKKLLLIEIKYSEMSVAYNGNISLCRSILSKIVKLLK